jgi:hypothetical protein
MTTPPGQSNEECAVNVLCLVANKVLQENIHDKQAIKKLRDDILKDGPYTSTYIHTPRE